MRCSSDGHLRAFFSSTKPVQWLVLVFVSVLARTPRVSASVSVTGGSGAMTSCGTPFVDTASSALLADVVLEGRVREKVYPPGDPGQPGGPGSGRYNVSIQVRKQMWKGRELVNKGKRPRKLLLGVFTSPQDSPLVTAAALSDSNNVDDVDSDDTNVVVNPAAAVGGTGGSSVGGVGGGDDDDEDGDVRLVDCVADVADGATYIFFLRDVGDKKGRYFEISAVPVKKNRRVSRIVSKILKNNGAQPPRIQRVKGPKRVTKGSSMTLRCKAKAKPTPLFTWYRNGQEIKSGRGQRIKNSKRGSRLKVSRVDTDDSGVYTCLARNAVGEASKNVTVKVRGSELSDQTYNFYEYMNEDANATDYVSVTAPEMIHKACEKQTFCFNGGTCRYIPDLQQTFCQCPEEWAGQRCELLDVNSIRLRNKIRREATLLYERTLIIVGIVIALLVFVVICIASYFLANRRRKRWEKRRRVKQTLDHQGDPLLDNTDGNMQPQFLPGNRPRAQKETQTENDIHPPDLPPPKRENESEPNFINHPVNSGNIFRDHSFPLITSAATTTTATPPPSGPSQRPARPVSDKELRDPEKRESRSRLKAVSVDDNCKDRPRSWQRSSDVPDSKSMPIITDCDPAEAIEMDTFGPRPTSNSSPKLSVGDNDDDSGGGGGSSALPGFLSSTASPELRPVPAKTERQPRDNAHAQLKTPEEEAASFTHPAVLPPPDYYDLQEPLLARQPGNQKGADPAPPGTEEMLPVNGVQEDWDSDGDEPDTPLPLLHISEEDLNGNVSKLDSFDSEYLPPPPPPPERFATEPVSHSPPPPPANHRPKNLTTALVDGVYVPPVGRSPGSLSEDDSAGFLPNTLSSTEAGSPLLEDTPPGEAYAFDPCTYSDPDDLDEQFMHGSPKKGSGGLSGAEDKQDYERRLRNVRADQEAIPI